MITKIDVTSSFFIYISEVGGNLINNIFITFIGGCLTAPIA